MTDQRAEAQTMTWDKVVVDRSSELSSWVDFSYQIMKRGVLIYAYANNHFVLCRRRHYAASRIMPNPLMSSIPFSFHSCLSKHTNACVNRHNPTHFFERSCQTEV